MKKSNYIIILSVVLAAVLWMAMPVSALASIPSSHPLRVRNLTAKDTQTLNNSLRNEFKLIDSDLRQQFNRLLKQVSLMGFSKDQSRKQLSEASGVDQTLVKMQ